LAILVALDLRGGARQIFLGGNVRELALMSLLARAIERSADLGDARSERIVIGADPLVFLFEPLDLAREQFISRFWSSMADAISSPVPPLTTPPG